jgi:endonuclease/exonuclease/phosphatase family metal-dependent hydrolase
MKIATWNLQRPGKTKAERATRLQARIAAVDADIWILTETNAIIVPGQDFSGVASPPVPGLHRSGENWTTIWSRFPILSVIPTCAPETSVCVEIEGPSGRILVYGTVLPYHADRIAGEGLRSWQSHYESIPLHEQDWLEIRAKRPEHHFCLAGDLNQSRDGRRWNGRLWYGTNKGREMLTRAFERCDLKCLTEEDFVAAKKLKTRSTIDHICVDTSWASSVQHVDAWEPTHDDGIRISDHNGVVVELNTAESPALSNPAVD